MHLFSKSIVFFVVNISDRTVPKKRIKQDVTAENSSSDNDSNEANSIQTKSVIRKSVSGSNIQKFGNNQGSDTKLKEKEIESANAETTENKHSPTCNESSEKNKFQATGEKLDSKGKDLSLEASNIGSVFIGTISASQAKPFTLPSSGFAKTKDANNRNQSVTSEDSEGDTIMKNYISVFSPLRL